MDGGEETAIGELGLGLDVFHGGPTAGGDGRGVEVRVVAQDDLIAVAHPGVAVFAVELILLAGARVAVRLDAADDLAFARDGLVGARLAVGDDAVDRGDLVLLELGTDLVAGRALLILRRGELGYARELLALPVGFHLDAAAYGVE